MKLVKLKNFLTRRGTRLLNSIIRSTHMYAYITIKNKPKK